MTTSVQATEFAPHMAMLSEISVSVPYAMTAFNTAVIDIGSNSVRLVIYRIEGRSIWPVYNEKVLAGLGREVRLTNSLDPKARLETLTALKRFKAILDSYRLTDIHVVATAAIREAKDGLQFSHEIFEATGLKVRILSGAEEAYYAAQGVVCGHAEASGIVGDLGGSSLELINLDQNGDVSGITLPLGPFALGAPQPLDLIKTTKSVVDILTPYQDRFHHKIFHAVGGAWRNLALIWMQKSDYPLKVVQQFELPASEALSIARFIAQQSPSSLDKIHGVTKKRLENLGYASLVLSELIEVFQFETICFSANGVREGLLYDHLLPAIKNKDSLIEGCAAIGNRQGISPDIGNALAQWLIDFYASAHLSHKPDIRLIKAAAQLSDMGACLHPDHRADLVRDQVLRAPISGQNHFERVFLASSLYTRYCGDLCLIEPELNRRILGEDGAHSAFILGLALRLGCDLSAKSGVLLQYTHLLQSSNELSLTAKSGWEDLLLGEQSKKRAKALANGLKLNLKIGSF